MNKPLLKTLFIITFIFAGCSIYAQKYQNGLIDKTVALVGNEMIMLSQIESEVQMMQFQGYKADKNLRCEILERTLEQKLFLTQARLDSLKVNEDMVVSQLEQRLNDVLTQLGGEKETEKHFGKSLYKLRQEWTEAFRDQSLTQEMQKNVISAITELTPRQIETFYKNTPKDSLPIVSTQYQIRQIVVYPKKADAEMIVREKLLEFRERILAGESFSMLARMYSQDPGSAMKGGELGMASKSIFWPVFSDAAVSLKAGQVSPIVETPDGFHIIQLIEKQGEMFNARHILLKPTYGTKDREMAFHRLDSLKTLIVKDSIPFEAVAMYNSEDPNSRTNGGLVADHRTGSVLFEKDQLKPADYTILKDMKEGQISAPFESVDDEGRSGNLIYKIIKLEKIIPSHVANFKQDYNLLSELAKNKQSMEAINKFIKEKQAITYIVIDPLFHNCNFEREGWIK